MYICITRPQWLKWNRHEISVTSPPRRISAENYIFHYVYTRINGNSGVRISVERVSQAWDSSLIITRVHESCHHDVWCQAIGYVTSRHQQPTGIGDFTKYGQPVPRPDPTWGVGIVHFQLWGWRYPSCAQTVPFFSVWIYLPNTWSNQLDQSERLIYAPLAWITTDSGNGLVSSLCQAIAWINFDL